MEERNKLLYMITAVLVVLGIGVSIVVYFMINGSMNDIEKTDFEYKNPSLVFTDGTEMSGSAVVDGIKAFQGYAVSISVTTLDGVTTIYNFDGKKELPTYADGGINAPGYINPSGRFNIKNEIGEDGKKVTRVVITQI